MPGRPIGVVRVSASAHPGARRLRPLLGQAEVEQLDARLRHHDVARLQIAMDESLAVRLVERVGQLHRVGEGLIERQRSARQALGERLALDELHHEVAPGAPDGASGPPASPTS